VNFLILHGKIRRGNAIIDDPNLISDYPIFENNKEFHNDVEELKELYLDGQCNDGGIIQLTLNELMTTIEVENDLENLFAKKYEMINLYRCMNTNLDVLDHSYGSEVKVNFDDSFGKS
jgi:hypothetical protein